MTRVGLRIDRRSMLVTNRPALVEARRDVLEAAHGSQDSEKTTRAPV